LFVQLYGWFRDHDHIYIAMEYIEGGDLKSFIKNRGRAMTEPESQIITRQIIEGLIVMHSYGITHRDLKPEVCYLDNLGFDSTNPAPTLRHTFLSDFGIMRKQYECEQKTLR